MENKQEKMTPREFAMFMWVTLFNESVNWGLVMEGNVKHRVKQLYNNYKKAGRQLSAELVNHIDLDEVSDDSEVFSRVIEIISDQNEVQDKQELYRAMCDFVKYKQDKKREQREINKVQLSFDF